MSDPEIRPHLGLDEIPSSNPLKNLGSGALAVVAAGKQLWKYMKMRDDANLLGADKYFHVLAFGTAAQIMKDGGVPQSLIRSILTNAGFAKEVFDRFQDDWLDDLSANSAGMEAALSGEGDFCELAFNISGSYGLRTWNELLASSSDDGRVWWVDNYGWAQEAFPQHYGPNKIFIQPRYNCRLSPDQRSEAYALGGKTSDTSIVGPLRAG